jgi:intracellular multiplication protein IcmK
MPMRPVTFAALLALSPLQAFAQAQPAPPSVESLLIAAAQAPVGPNPALQQLAPAQAAPGAVRASTGKSRRDEAFENAVRQINPLTPGQIREFRTQDNAVKRAMTAPIAPGRPVSRALRVTLRPGEMPPQIRVEPGLVSTLTFSDVTGQPWPVLSVVVGNPAAYVAQSAGEEGKSNIVVVSATAQYVPSNIAVTLVGHPVPILMSVEQGQPETDFRVDLRIDAKGPNAAQDIVGVSSLAPTSDATMMRFLDGTPPPGSRKMNTSAPDMVEAWRYEDILYIRTRGELLSPVYTARSNNVAGVNLFQMADSPIVLVSEGGRTSSVSIRR